MADDIAIRVENLSKRYRIGAKEEAHDTLAGMLGDWVKRPGHNLRRLRRLTQFDENGLEQEDIIWALKDVSFEVKRGEVVGIIGRNGAGKSTLLKILSRITHPTKGRVELNGRVSSLLEVGTGFHPELTGRENIYLNGTILGMRRSEIDRKFDEIVDFSGIEKFIETPVKRYSSGMRVRLAFSVAAHLEPEIMLIDEVLAVGDAAFQKKCLGKMGNVAREGRTVLFVSHNMGAIAELCPRTISLTDGSLFEDGNSISVISSYLAESVSEGEIDLSDWTVDRSGNGPMLVLRLATRNGDGTVGSRFMYGESIIFDVDIIGNKGSGCVLGIAIRDMQGNVILHLNNTDDGFDILSDGNKVTQVRVQVPSIILKDGDYYVTIWLGDSFNVLHDRVGNCLQFIVDSSALGQSRSQGLVRVSANWSVQ